MSSNLVFQRLAPKPGRQRLESDLQLSILKLAVGKKDKIKASTPQPRETLPRAERVRGSAPLCGGIGREKFRFFVLALSVVVSSASSSLSLVFSDVTAFGPEDPLLGWPRQSSRRFTISGRREGISSACGLQGIQVKGMRVNIQPSLDARIRGCFEMELLAEKTLWRWPLEQFDPANPTSTIETLSFYVSDDRPNDFVLRFPLSLLLLYHLQ